MDIPHTNASHLTYMESLRAIFYLLLPSESVFEHSSQVPDYVTAAIPHFIVMMGIEMLIMVWKGKHNLRINDKITSIGAGMYSEVLSIAGLKTIDFSMYSYIHTHFRLFALPWDSPWTWIFMALTFDFLYYCIHRMSHEVNLLWNTHQTHHSSEDYGLPTALRQGAAQTYTSMFIYLPAALLVPPSAYLVHRQLNLLYQFWIHTEVVDKLGPLEYILNTPSHHRVHHGRNPYCIDKNYAAVLIIWDKMFGTFQPERKDEKVVYGLVHNINTFDSNLIQVGHWFSFAKRFWCTSGFYNKLGFLFKGPGWTPGSPRLGNPEDIPKIENHVVIYDPTISRWLYCYVVVQCVTSVAIFNHIASLQLVLPAPMIASACVFILVTLTCIGFIFDKRPFAFMTEFFRCAICLFILHINRREIVLQLQVSESVVVVFLTSFFLSSLVWPFFILKEYAARRKEKCS